MKNNNLAGSSLTIREMPPSIEHSSDKVLGAVSPISYSDWLKRTRALR
jgi:hypothetical protein